LSGPTRPQAGQRVALGHISCVRDRWPLHGLMPLGIERPVNVKGEVPSGFLTATSSAGLIHFREGQPQRLLDGSWYFGLTSDGASWYAFERTGLHGRVVRFRLDGDERVRTAVWGLPWSIHQIDIVRERLLVMDARHNRVLGYAMTGLNRPRAWVRTTLRALPAGSLRAGRDSPNYAHFNSIFATVDDVYLIAHNAWRFTGRESELFTLDHDLNLRDVRSLGGRNCHNYCRFPYGSGEQEVFLRSDAGEIVVDGDVAYKCQSFLRGLAVGRECRLVGTSGHRNAQQRASGETGNGRVLVFDPAWTLVGTITVPLTQLFDVRLTGEPDFARSARIPP